MWKDDIVQRMGHVGDHISDMGEYDVEERSESFYLRGEFNGLTDEEFSEYKKAQKNGEEPPLYVKRRHGIVVYENGDTNQGTVEILNEDIPKVRACLDVVEWHNQGKTIRSERMGEGVVIAWEVRLIPATKSGSMGKDPVILARVRSEKNAQRLAELAAAQEKYDGEIIVQDISIFQEDALWLAAQTTPNTDDFESLEF